MNSQLLMRGLAAVIAGAVLLPGGGALAQAEDCSVYSASVMMLGSEVRRAGEAASEADYQAKKAQRQADRIRAMPADSLARSLTVLENGLKDQEDRLATEGPNDERELRVRELKISINALKDAQQRATDVELTGGFISSDRNAMDTYAKELEARIPEAKERERRTAQSLKDAERALADCLARKERQDASLARDAEVLASADGADDYDDGGYGDGYDGVASDAYPPRPSLRPPRVRQARPDRADPWNASAAYDGTRDVRPDRRARRDGWREDARGGDRVRADRRQGGRMRAANAPRDDRRGGKGGGKRNKRDRDGNGQSHCHTNPLTGEQHCGKG